MIAELYTKLRKLNVKVKLVDGNLDIKAPKGVLTGELLAEIKQHKPALIDLISAYKQKREDYNAIHKADTQDHYPLSASQYRLWILSQFEQSNVAYNSPGVYLFEGQLNVASLQYSLEALIARHESLRTVFREDGQGNIRQWVLAPREVIFNISYHDLREGEQHQRVGDQQQRQDDLQQKQLTGLIQSAAATAFDLSTGPLFRAALYQLEDHKWVFGYVIHHIVMDAWSMGIFINELLQLYNAHATGSRDPLLPLRLQYKDYVIWQQSQLSGTALQRHKDYWLRQFEGEIPVLDLPGDHVRPAIKTYRAASVNRRFDPSVSKGIISLINERGASLFMGLLAVANALLYRYTRQDDMIIGTPIAGREHADLGDQIGYYGNTLALRIQSRGTDSYQELLEKVKQVVLDAYEHQVYPFEDLVEALQLQRDMSRTPLFDVQVIVGQDAVNKTKQSLGELKVSEFDVDNLLHSRFDIVLNFAGTGTELGVNVLYNADIYDQHTIERLTAHLEQLMAAIIAEPGKPVQQLKYLDAAEQHRLMVDFNDTATSYPPDDTIVSLIEKQVVKHPEDSAVVFRNTTLTYRQLDESANQLAHYLRAQHQVQANDLVGIMLDRSEKSIISIMGVLKAGAAYVPIDPAIPLSRKEFILQDTGMKVLITQTDYIFDLDFYDGAIFAIDVQLESIGTPVTSPAIVLHANDLAYVIYTSGSTGNPKGVMIEHAAICNSILAQLEVYDVGVGDRNLQFAASSFDTAVSEIFMALVSGGALYIIEEDKKKDPVLLGQYITENKIDFATITPAYVKLLQMESIKTLRKLVTAGEAAVPETARAFSQYGTYFNAYGPTETSICVTIFKLNPGETIQTGSVPIGRPLPNTSIYILDEQLEMVPVGIIGELCVGGAGLAREYLNQPELTATKFIRHPFKPGERLYRTGDLARWLPDGNIVFAGRKDDQIKIRGYRIEPGEIEKVLKTYPGVEMAVVLARMGEDGDKDLVAYLVSNAPLNTRNLRTHLGRTLPDHMIPAHYIRLDHLPVTSHGKLDKKKLPAVEASGAGSVSTYVAPRSEQEEKITTIWASVLGREKIGIRDGFFDLGGDSIKILKMVSELRKVLDLEVSVADLYKHNTIEGLIDNVLRNKEAIEDSRRERLEMEAIVTGDIQALKDRILSSGTPLDKDNIADIYPMSDVEKGMVFESLMDKGVVIYHDQMVRRRRFVDFTIGRLLAALELLVEKHAILRTGFNVTDHEVPVQIVYKSIPVSIHHEDLSDLGLPTQEATIRDFMKAALGRPFDVTRAPLWRMAVFNLGSSDIVFVFECHHAIIDGWSDALFMTELNNLYLQLGEDPSFKPAELQLTYKDFIIQHEIDKKDVRVKDFWLKELSDYKRLDLFTETIEVSSYAGYLDNGHVKKLEQLAVDWKTSIKAISFAAYLFMLKVLNGEDEIVAGLVTNTRLAREDGDKVLGCFLNAIPYRIGIEDTLTCEELTHRVQAKLVELKNYERMSVMQLADLYQERDAGNHFFDTFFNYVDFHVFGSLAEDGPVEPAASPETAINLAGHGLTNTYLDLTVNRTGGAYQMGLHLTRQLRSGFSAERLGRLYFAILTGIIDSPDKKLSQLDYIPAAERDQLLFGFNDTATDYPGHSTIVRLFEEQVKRTPDNVALAFEGQRLTYAALNDQSNQLADYLRRRYHIYPDDTVGIQLDRNEDLVIALLGVLKSGGACVPMAAGYPPERIDYIMKDSNCKVLIDKAELMNFRKTGQQYSKADPEPFNDPDDLVCVIYTSGSSGAPKGCMLENRGIINHLFSKIDLLQLNDKSVICHNSQLHFVGGIWQLWAPLIVGGQCVLCNEEELQSIDKLLNRALVSGTSMLEVIPSQLNEHLFYEGKIDMTGIKTLILTGEKLNTYFVDRCYDGNEQLQIINTYGQTECSDVTTSYKIPRRSDSGQVLIGRPIQNTQIYILTPAETLCPIGVIGEICTGGDGVSRGYIKRPELTAEKFIAHPFRVGERLYKTGDLGKWLPDGNIIVIGRKDAQVKIRGYRIESGEIENALYDHEMITSAVVIARPNAKAENELIAYIVAKSPLNSSALRAYLGKRLPDYMLPAYFVQLESLPLTANGKVDRKRLPAPEGPGMKTMETGVVYIAPRNETEAQLVQIWQEILGRDRVGVNDNFYALGGHSIAMIRLMNKVNAAFGKDRVRLIELMQGPTIAQIAMLIDTAGSRAGQNPHITILRGGSLSDAIFIIPGMPGIIDGYLEMAQKIPAPGPVYGLQMIGLLEGESPLESIEAMAAHNIALIRSVQPAGRIRLYAHSYGGTIVYEMLKQLKDTGIEVTDVVLIECMPLGPGAASDKQMIDRFLDDFFEGNGLSGEKQRYHHLWTLCDNSLAIQYEFGEKLPYTITLVKAMGRQGPDSYGITEETAITSHTEKTVRTSLTGWEDHFQQVNILLATGDHFSIVREPHCSAWLADIIH